MGWAFHRHQGFIFMPVSTFPLAREVVAPNRLLSSSILFGTFLPKGQSNAVKGDEMVPPAHLPWAWLQRKDHLGLLKW